MSLKDPAARALYLREWRAKNPDKVAAYRPKDHKAHYAKNRTKILAQQKAYRGSNPKAQAAASKNWRARNPTVWLLGNARRRAKSLGLDFSLERSDLTLVDVCPITGLTLSYTNAKLSDNSATVDRVDTTKGYVPGNVRIISNRANWRKSDFTLEEIERLYRYSRGEL